MKPYYDHAGITIFLGDCREILPTVKADVMVTDPPYGIAHPTDYRRRGRGALAACRDYVPVYGDDSPFDPTWLLSFQKKHIFWGANWYSDKLPPMGGWLVWDKERPDDLDQATCELAWTDCVKGVRRIRHLWHGMMRATKEPIVHPTQKPIVVMKWCMSFPGWTDSGVVIDPYMGSGTTLVAAKELGRKAVGIEICEAYAEIAAKRLSQEVFDFGAPVATAKE